MPVKPVAQFLDALEAFRRAHGHRAPREAELSCGNPKVRR